MFFPHRFPSGHSEPRRRWKWKTLLHRIITACRVTGGRLVNHASLFRASAVSCLHVGATLASSLL